MNIQLIVSGIIREKKISHSGLELDWWLDVDKLHLASLYHAAPIVEALENIIPRPGQHKLSVAGIERGGYLLACFQRAHSGVLKVKKDNTVEIIQSISNWNCVLWDDVVTTGQSMIEAEKALAKHGIFVTKRICILDRRQELKEQVLARCSCRGISHTGCTLGKYRCEGLFLEIESLFTTSDLVEANLISV